MKESEYLARLDADAADGTEQGGISLAGLVRRISKLADDHTFPRQTARLVCLKFLAALTSRLGKDRIIPFLPTILRPLYRISEGSSPTPEEVQFFPYANSRAQASLPMLKLDTKSGGFR